MMEVIPINCADLVQFLFPRLLFDGFQKYFLQIDILLKIRLIEPSGDASGDAV